MKDASVFPGEHTDVQALLLEDGVDYRIFFREGSTYSTITVIAHDAPYLLSRIAAVFLSCDAGIVDASVQTTDQGKAVDIFRVYDLITGTAIQAEKQEQIERTLAAVLAKETDTEELFRRHREKWKRKLRNVINPVTRIDVMYQQHVSDAGVPMTIIDVYAPDTLGLLYRLTDQISSFRLNILAAKIATRVDGVVDSFYVAEANGEPLTNPRIQKELRRALLHQIQRLTTISVA
jgi:[protein-PII] uridylyltransferase